jgi:lysozyme
MTTYLDIQAAFTKRAESCVLTGMLDSGKVPTWGWGHTGAEVQVGVQISQEHADTDFIRDQAEADARLKRHVPPEPFAALDEHEKAALLDFCFNSGGGSFAAKDEWTIWKDVRAGNLADVPAQLGRFVYVHVDGKPVTSKGLKNRRTAEVVLWNTADVEAAVASACAGGEQACSASTRTLPTPPEPSAPKTLANTSLAVKCGTALTGACGAVASAIPDLQGKASAIHDLAQAHADNHYIAAVATTMSAAVFGLGVVALFVHDHQQKAAKV